MQKRYIDLWIFLVVLLCGLSCTQSNQESKSDRFIILSPAITETIFTLGGQDSVMGRSDYCLHPEEAKALPSFGTALTPNLEQIALAMPSGLLFDGALGTPQKELSGLASIRVLPWLTAEDMASSIEELGTLINKEQKANQLAQKVRSTLSSRSTKDSPKMLALMSGSDTKKGIFWYMRTDSLHGAAVEAAGFTNLAPKGINGPPSMSAEELLSKDPDIIIFICGSDIDEVAAQKIVQDMSKFTMLKAVQNNNVGYILGENRMGIGPGIMELVNELKREGDSLLSGKR
jgi:iron complex transport system substrate-binding protein